MNIKLRYKVLAVLALGGVLYMKGCMAGRKPTPSQSAPAVLPQNDTEQITVDPIHHKISILTPSGLKTETLPDRKSTIDIQKDGQVIVKSAQYGFEERPFIGVQASNHFRFMAGSDQFFYKKLDLGLGIGVQPNLGSVVGFGQISYDVYNNTRIGLTYDTERHVGLSLSVRL